MSALAHVITVLNHKGGVGKTHASWLIACVSEERQQRVLLIDLDTQANLTSSFLDVDDGLPTVTQFFDPAAEPDPFSLIRRTRFAHIDIIPSSPLLAPFDLSDQRVWERSDLHLSMVDALQALRPHYDLIIFDCPPRLSLVSFSALCASDFVIVPMEAADWGAKGIRDTTAAIDYVRQKYNSRLTLLGYLVSRFKQARLYQRTYLEQLRAHYGATTTFDTVINDLSAFERAVTDRIPPHLYAPRSRAAAVARRFVDEITSRIALRSESGESVRADRLASDRLAL